VKENKRKEADHIRREMIIILTHGILLENSEKLNLFMMREEVREEVLMKKSHTINKEDTRKTFKREEIFKKEEIIKRKEDLTPLRNHSKKLKLKWLIWTLIINSSKIVMWLEVKLIFQDSQELKCQ